MKIALKKLLNLPILICLIICCSAVTSCSDESTESPSLIIGQWSDSYGVITFGKDGSYREDGSLGQYRIGTYSYNPSLQLLTVNVKAIEGMNSAYQTTYIVQTLSSTTLVLLYTDGDVKGFYTRKQ